MLLSPPHDDGGGCFTTTDGSGAVTAHDLARGDAILFCSDTIHNVTTLRGGKRMSLVIELWTNGENRKDRFS